MRVEIPGCDAFDIETVILDLNGTIAVDGKLIEGVAERIQELRKLYRLVLFTGDTQGNAGAIAQQLQLEVRVTKNALEKAAQAQTLEPEKCATIGNGRIDLELFKTVRLRLAVIEKEGLNAALLGHADVFFTSILDALDFLLLKNRQIATFRR